ncbi:MAG: DUF4252 domain-containing protein [Flavobacterium sp.]
MRAAFYLGLLASVFMVSCNDKPTLQKYYVDNSERKGFIVLDVSPDIINTNKAKLTAEQKKALESFDKMNILAFTADSGNQKEYEEESQKLSQILKDKAIYQELMKINSGKDGASVSYVGDENHINEFVFFAKKKENGFAVIRVLGNDMNPNNIMNIISVLQQSNVNLEQLKPLQGLLRQPALPATVKD